MFGKVSATSIRGPFFIFLSVRLVKLTFASAYASHIILSPFFWRVKCFTGGHFWVDFFGIKNFCLCFFYRGDYCAANRIVHFFFLHVLFVKLVSEKKKARFLGFENLQATFLVVIFEIENFWFDFWKDEEKMHNNWYIY